MAETRWTVPVRGEERQEVDPPAPGLPPGFVHGLEPALRPGHAAPGGLGPHPRDVQLGGRYGLHELRF